MPAKAQKKAPAAPSHPDVGLGTTSAELNAVYRDKVAKAVQTIFAHPIFHGIDEHPPLAVTGQTTDVGYIAPFNAASLKNIFAAFTDDSIATASYTAGMNFFSQDFSYTPTPGVPIRQTEITNLMTHSLSKPSQIPFTFSAAIESVHAPVMQLAKNHKIKAVSPEEVRFCSVCFSRSGKQS